MGPETYKVLLLKVLWAPKPLLLNAVGLACNAEIQEMNRSHMGPIDFLASGRQAARLRTKQALDNIKARRRNLGLEASLRSLAVLEANFT